MSSWNGSNNESSKHATTKKKSSSPKTLKTVFSVIVAFAAIFACVIFFRREKPKVESIQDRRPEIIKEVKPTAKPVAQVVSEEQPKPRKKSNARAKTYIDEKGVKRYEGGARVFDGPRRAPIKLIKEKPLFHNYAENQISTLLTTKPGDTIFVTRKYDKRFLDAFEKSLKEPILIGEDDSERDKELKRAMNETKADLAQRMRDGEDICNIMEETYSELQRLSQVKRDVVKMAREMMKDNPEMTAQEADDLVKATNKMLEEKGCAPIKNTSLLGKNFRLNIKAQRENKSQSAATK